MMVSAIAAAWALTTTAVTTLPPGPGPLDNPLKGYAAYNPMVAREFYAPTSMSFTYVSWRELEPEPGKYAFDAFEKRYWKSDAARGKHVVFRVYLDYPQRPTGVPQWLLDAGVKLTAYNSYGGGLSPDYDDPFLIQHLQKFIAALGKRYDSNPRVAFVQMGILGFWGEWHNYPENHLFAAESTQKVVASSMRKAFPTRMLMGRYGDYPALQISNLGFHDDMIPDDTLLDRPTGFLARMQKGKTINNWKIAPTGGEMEPRQAQKWLGAGWERTKAAVREAHLSWMGGYSPAMDPSKDPVFNKRREELIRLLGYEYQWRTLEMLAKLSAGADLRINLIGVNQGVAPFYYPWRVKFVLLGDTGEIRDSWNSSADIRKWMPGKMQLKTQRRLTVPAGRYRVAVGIIDPWSGLPSIRFANRLPEFAGYTVLGAINVTE